VVTVLARREAVGMMKALGVSERRACGHVGISGSVLRYCPRPDRNEELRGRIVALASQHRRHGYRMIHGLLQAQGEVVNHKRVYRLYRQEDLLVKRRRRRKRALLERVPLVRPGRANEVWSMDFVMDELADGRRLKCLTLLDDCSKESVAIASDTSITGAYVARLLDQVKLERGLPQAIRTDNGPEFASKAMALWAYRNAVQLRFIRPGKPIENAYIESFNGRFREECLSEHWFETLAHARHEIERWRRYYNERRPHSALGYVPPAVYAGRLAAQNEPRAVKTEAI
jgi:putative transposase